MGQSVAHLALQAGAKVYATDLDATGLEALQSLGATTEVLGIRNKKLVNDYFSSIPDFDGLVNIAGWVHHGTILDVDETDWRKSLINNIDSMYYVLRAAIPGLQR